MAAGLAVALAACTAAAPDGGGDQWSSPLGEYLAAAWGLGMTSEERTQQLHDRLRQQEELVARCMAEQGFEYVPYVDLVDVDFVERRPDDREWVAEWGFGIVRQALSPAADEPQEAVSNPNTERVAGYSPAQRAAWEKALFGDLDAMGVGDDGVVVWDANLGGCRGWATRQVDGEHDLLARPEFIPLVDALFEFYGQVHWDQTSPHLAEAVREWAACMTIAGHGGFRNPRALQEYLGDRLDRLGLHEIEGDPWQYRPLRALAEYEVTVALADFDCRAEIDFDARAAAAREAAELEFIEAHRDQLTALRAAAEQVG